ncbi:nuclear protein 2 isoform X2 [Heteronotia binoei]|uniref:nuclear protein 2 isoform X2 n=1 Tax=Heteronotia binoei TaxID=13085 RepID=UPI00292E975B|nr:nuclear protein 2 isoform X2 [Heteronotia binoei]
MGRGRSQTRRAAKVAKAPPVAPEESASSLVSDVEAEAEQVDELREAVSRGGPRGLGSGGKGRSRREREQNTNWPVPAGHERKISSKIRATLAKRRRRQQRTGGTRARGPAKAKAAETTDG